MAPFFSLTLPLFLFLSPFFLRDGQFFTSYEYCIKLATRLLVLRGLPQTQAGRPRPTQRALLPLFSCKAQPTDCSESKPAELSSLTFIQWRSGPVWPILCRFVLRFHIHIYAPTFHMNENGLIFIEATKLLILSSKSQLEAVEIFCMKTLHVVNRNPQRISVTKL